MAELSLKEVLACKFCFLADQCDCKPLILASGCQEPFEQADSIINLMLAKVDKAELTKKQIAEIDKAINNYDSVFYKEWLKNEDTKLNYRDWRIAKAQLQAIKSLFKGK